MLRPFTWILLLAAGWATTGVAWAQEPPKTQTNPEVLLGSLDAEILAGNADLKKAAATQTEADLDDAAAVAAERQAKELRQQAALKRKQADALKVEAKRRVAAAEIDRAALVLKIDVAKKAKLPATVPVVVVTEDIVVAAEKKAALKNEQVVSLKVFAVQAKGTADEAKKAWDTAQAEADKNKGNMALETEAADAKAVYTARAMDQATADGKVLAAVKELDGLIVEARRLREALGAERLRVAQAEALAKLRTATPAPKVELPKVDSPKTKREPATETKVWEKQPNGKYREVDKPVGMQITVYASNWTHANAPSTRSRTAGTWAYYTSGGQQVYLKYYPEGGTNSDGSRFAPGFWEEFRFNLPTCVTVYYTR